MTAIRFLLIQTWGEKSVIKEEEEWRISGFGGDITDVTFRAFWGCLWL